jgi:hypothetical protein
MYAGDAYLADIQNTPSMLGASSGNIPDSAFYGPSSAGSFMENVRRLVETSMGGDQESRITARDQINHVQPLSKLRINILSNEKDYILPSRRAADRLLLAYWEHMHVLYPFLDQAEFQETYESVWSGCISIPNEGLFLCSLNATFAIGTQLVGSDIFGEREKAADEFATRARASWTVLDPPSLLMVQSYLLLSLYYQSTHESHACWLLVGLAIRTALSLGLHHPETSAKVSEPKSQELIRRVWYGCVLMDRVVTMTYGRPSEVGPRTAAMVPFPRPTEGLSTLETHTVALGDFYSAILGLHEILHDVLFSFYRHNDSSKPTDGSATNYFGLSAGFSLYELDKRLHEWQDKLPHHLNWESSVQDRNIESASRRQTTVLQQRYRVLLVL